MPAAALAAGRGDAPAINGDRSGALRLEATQRGVSSCVNSDCRDAVSVRAGGGRIQRGWYQANKQ